MKIMPMYFREAMTEFFGKRGRSWRVSSVIRQEQCRKTVESFVHVFDSKQIRCYGDLGVRAQHPERGEATG